jgi:hypothetical protein
MNVSGRKADSLAVRLNGPWLCFHPAFASLTASSQFATNDSICEPIELAGRGDTAK